VGRLFVVPIGAYSLLPSKCSNATWMYKTTEFVVVVTSMFKRFSVQVAGREKEYSS